jgi:hypothetical protein
MATTSGGRAATTVSEQRHRDNGEPQKQWGRAGQPRRGNHDHKPEGNGEGEQPQNKG